MNYRDTASFGKRLEYVVIAELLKRGLDVYNTLVDDRGIDCILRLDNDNKPIYLDIQIKSRSKSAKDWNSFASMSFTPRGNYFFIFYTEKTDTFWVIPSMDLESLCSVNTKGKNKGTKTLNLPTKDGEKMDNYSKYKGERGFELLAKYGLRK